MSALVRSLPCAVHGRRKTRVRRRAVRSAAATPPPSQFRHRYRTNEKAARLGGFANLRKTKTRWASHAGFRFYILFRCNAPEA